MRGEVFAYVNPRGKGNEQAGKRYAVVLQSDDLYLSTWLVAPTSTKVIPTDFRPEVEVLGTRTYVLAEQATAINPERLGATVGFLTWDEMQRVDVAMRRVLDL